MLSTDIKAPDANSALAIEEHQKSAKPFASALRESRAGTLDLKNEPMDIDSARAFMSSLKIDPMSPSVGAASMIEPEHFIENPFAEPEEKENAVTQDARKKRPLPMASTLSLIHISEPTRQCCTSRMPSSA